MSVPADPPAYRAPNAVVELFAYYLSGAGCETLDFTALQDKEQSAHAHAWRSSPELRATSRAKARLFLTELNEQGLRLGISSQRLLRAQLSALETQPATRAYSLDSETVTEDTVVEDDPPESPGA